MGKSKRNESDWDIIKAILARHDLIVFGPEKEEREYKVYDHIMSEDGILQAFTNLDDCMRHIQWLNEDDGTPGRKFVVGGLPFEQIIRASDYYGRDLLIDMTIDGKNRSILYLAGKGEIKAVSLVR